MICEMKQAAGQNVKRILPGSLYFLSTLTSLFSALYMQKKEGGVSPRKASKSRFYE